MTRVFYPRGGGGNWLSNLIWHLEKADFSLPDADPDTIVKILQPHAEYYLQRTTPLAFEWATQ